MPHVWGGSELLARRVAQTSCVWTCEQFECSPTQGRVGCFLTTRLVSSGIHLCHTCGSYRRPKFVLLKLKRD
uniref:Uncharacterized protein n=1 Tax=Triticum urartu TaxID=4572 RepID=A0A8R7TEA6_TRIUA